jgi:hypothetical protein
LLKIKGEKCHKSNENQAYHFTYIYFHCGKTIGLPILLLNKTNQNEQECQTVFEWYTNQVCNTRLFNSKNEVPCYLTLSEKSNKTNKNNYLTINFNPLLQTRSSSQNNLTNFYQVIKKDETIDISLDLCRYGSSSKNF